MAAQSKRVIHNGYYPPVKRSTLDYSTFNWESTMEKVIQSVISIHFGSVTPFDTEDAYVSEATGFVVDSENGIIMTNRHVVGPGPFYGYAVFDNHEECSLKAIYRDPVHDFGFLKFDPTAIRHMPIVGLQLRPELAKVGCEIRVVGNDAGEKLSILSGVISRLDRNTPDYGEFTYNDFNTEYIQAAASASGGSSGSPVVDLHANVLALQAGGSTSASTDFFLPLYRAKRALECIQKGEPVSRGTIQVQWLLKPYDECTRLGLTDESQKLSRELFPDSTGLLVGEIVLPDGPADGLIEEGDILLEVNGLPVSSFQTVDDVLDDNVGKPITLTVERSGVKRTFTPTVMDLHSVTPNRFVEFNGGVFHDLSYQVARLYGLPCKGVFVADGGLPFHGRDRSGWLLVEVNHQPVPNMDAFVEAVQNIPDQAQVPIKVIHVTDLYTVRNIIIPIDRHWAKDLRIATRDDTTGLWNFETIGKASPPAELTTQMARYKKVNINGRNKEACSKLSRSFVKVETLLPFKVEGYSAPAATENGVIVDTEKGLVLVSRYCVPHRLCDIRITIADSISVPAQVKFLHPQQNFAIIQFNPKLVDVDMEAVTFSDKQLQQGDELMFIGYNNHRLVHTETNLTDIVTISIPQSHEFSPRYRGINLENLALDTTTISECSSGVLADFNGVVRGIWLSFMGDVQERRDRQFRLAVDSFEIAEVVEKLRKGDKADPRFLDVEVGQIPVIHARVNGVNEKWLKLIYERELRPQFFSILRVSNTLKNHLKEGDILLAADGELFHRASQLSTISKDSVVLTLLRAGKEMDITVPTTLSSAVEVRTVVSWTGMLIHTPHHAVLQQIKEPPSYVYIAQVGASSPAHQRGVGVTQFITHVDGRAVQNMDEFYQIVKSLPDDTDVRVRVVSFDGIPSNCAIKTNYHYFPTAKVQLVGEKWEIEDNERT